MTDIASRFPQNPLISPSDLQASRPGLQVECLLNPGVFFWQGKIYLLVRVAEMPTLESGKTRALIMEQGGLKELTWNSDDPQLNISDPREIRYNGRPFLSTLSHLRLFVSDDGINFVLAPHPPHWGEGRLETYGIEDCRVTSFDDGRFFLTYTAISEWGFGAGLRETSDWKTFRRHGMILPPSNKDVAIFDRKVNGRYFCFHRPTGVYIGGNNVWIASSDNLLDWGGHIPIARPRPGMWDSGRIGAGAAPIHTDHGWLAIYHGADDNSRYCLGALLLDLDDPTKVLARSQDPIMEPLAEYEQTGFFGNVVFTNGHLVNGDVVTCYYGASDNYICGATFSIKQILASLRYPPSPKESVSPLQFETTPNEIEFAYPISHEIFP